MIRDMTDYLKKKDNPALLPIQIAYYTGLRIGEVCALTWQDIDLKEQTITVRRSMRYNGARHKTEVGTTKRSKIRTVDFCDTLATILKAARTEQHKNRFKYGELYSLNYYKQVQEKGRSYYELYSLQRSEEVPVDYREIDFVCLRPDGCFESSSTVGFVKESYTGLSPSTAVCSKTFYFLNLLPQRGPTTPTMPKHHRFGLFRVRSPLLAESLLFSSPMGT